MTRFIEYSSIGVSKDSQHRVAKIMGVICDGYQDFKSDNDLENFFEYGRCFMAERWERLRQVVAENGVFSLPRFPKQYCLFNGDFAESYPGKLILIISTIDYYLRWDICYLLVRC